MGPARVSVQAALPRASPYWPQRSHVTMQVHLGSLYTNQSILSTLLLSLPRPSEIEPFPIAFALLSPCYGGSHSRKTIVFVFLLRFSPPHIPENNEPKIYKYLEVLTINMASSCITGRKCFCEEKFNVCHSGITSGTCAVCIIYSAKFFVFNMVTDAYGEILSDSLKLSRQVFIETNSMNGVNIK